MSETDEPQEQGPPPEPRPFQPDPDLITELEKSQGPPSEKKDRKQKS